MQERQTRACPNAARALALLAILVPLACGRTSPKPPASHEPAGPSDAIERAARADSGAAADSLAVPRARPQYARFPLPGPAALAELKQAQGDSGLSVILKLNRIDLDHARAGDTLVVPAAGGPFIDLSPLPSALPAARAVKKLLLVSARVQAFAAYDSGRLVRWGPVSSGRKEKPTRPALYHANWKGRTHASTVDEAWILNWYVNLDNFEGISLHQYELPGRPASHSCVRLLEDDARWIYDWVETWKVAPDGRHVLVPGTPVVVFGEYAWGAGRPWKDLPDEPSATDVPLAEVEAALREYAVPGTEVPLVVAAAPAPAAASDSLAGVAAPADSAAGAAGR